MSSMKNKIYSLAFRKTCDMQKASNQNPTRPSILLKGVSHIHFPSPF
jgi:hypothetical protein